MWSHYADNHRGICLEFDANSELFRSCRRVAYRSKYPVMRPQTLLQGNFEQALLTKSNDWKYEDEYRIIAKKASAGGTSGDFMMASEDGYLDLPIGALRSVVAGCESNVELIAAIVKHYAPALSIKEVVRVPNHFRAVRRKVGS
jgi:hypothetical protein